MTDATQTTQRIPEGVEVEAAKASTQPVQRVFIYGSCVTRDTIPFLSDVVKVMGYVARQSMISAGTDARSVADQLPHFESAFQERQSMDDLAGSVYSEIAAQANRVDLLLIDLVDERGGVYPVGDGSFLTRSYERLAARADDVMSPPILFGSAEHFALWRRGFERWMAHIDAIGLLPRTAVLAVPWATAGPNGEATPASFGLKPEAANELFARYHDAVRAAGVRVISPNPATQVVADREHQWGFAPFHYAPPVYEDLAAQLDELMRGGPGPLSKGK